MLRNVPLYSAYLCSSVVLTASVNPYSGNCKFTTAGPTTPSPNPIIGEAWDIPRWENSAENSHSKEEEN